MSLKFGKAIYLLLLIFGVSGCASDLIRHGVGPTDFTSVYSGMPRSNFEDLVGHPIKLSETHENVTAIYEYDRGYIGCLASGRCQELTQGVYIWGRVSEVLFSIVTLGLLPYGAWYEINECQTGFLMANYKQGDQLISISLLDPDPYINAYLWEKDIRKPWLNNPCREIYFHPRPLTIPKSILDKSSFPKNSE
jgi:hypothetical protein